MRRKIISKNNGYSLFFEKCKKGNVKCTAYHTDFHMTGNEIAEVLGVSNVTISQLVRQGVEKVYLRYRRNGETPFEVMSIMAEMLNVKTESQYNKLFNLFPDEIKGEIYTDAKRIFN